MYQFLSLGLCDSESFLRTMKIGYLILTIIKIVVPLLIIILGMSDFAKVIMSGKEDEIKKSSTMLLRRLIAGIIIVLLPTILDFFFNLSVQYQQTASEFAGCTVCLTNANDCNTLIEVAKVNDERRRQEDASKYAITEEDIKNWKEKVAQRDKAGSTQYVGQPSTSQGSGQTRVAVGNGKYFDSTNVTKISGLSESELYSVIENSTAYKGKAKVYLPLVHDLYLAEQNHGVNAFYLIGLYSYESGWLGSYLTNHCNNIGGVRYYNQSYGNGKKTTDCWKRYAGFDSIAEFIDFHANLLETKYLTPGGSHYYGTSVADVAKDYGSGNGINTIIEIATKVSTQ
jgi:beta-N-acetylglucosaminidase